MLHEQGFESEVLGGNCFHFDENDAEALSSVIDKTQATCVLVDSYAVTDEFLVSLKSSCVRFGVKAGYIDDDYRFESGFSPEPVRLPVDILINYGFATSLKVYERAYSGASVKLLICPRFAPVRG